MFRSAVLPVVLLLAAKIPFDPDVVWVVLNTTGNGMLSGTVHLEDAPANEEFGINVQVRYENANNEVFEDVEVGWDLPLK